MARPKHNPLPEEEQKRQRSRTRAQQLKEAGGKAITVRLENADEVKSLDRVMKQLHMPNASETFRELLRRFDKGEKSA